MIYRKFKDMELPNLGFGAMRLPIIGEDFTKIDEEQMEKMISYAMDNGVNYFDTAYGYHEGESEKALGRILSKYPRDSYYLADKFPGYDLSMFDKIEETFEDQLKRCQVDYFDFYLLHNVSEINIEQYLNKDNKLMDYMLEQKKSGCIKHLGFSAHGSYDLMKRFLDVYGDDMEFCQIQLNYMDWSFQNGEDKVNLLKEYNLPIWIMEPLRGGQLANLPDEDMKSLKFLRADETKPGWAFRFLQSIPEAVVVLSGMSNFDQVKENIEIFNTDEPLSTEEFEAVTGVGDVIIKKVALPCTECRYCTEYCPQKLDIPMLINLYNEHCSTKIGFIAPMALAVVPEDKQPKACTGCKSCEAVCPQNIKISEAMSDFLERLS